jgi:hypothetical protein
MFSLRETHDQPWCRRGRQSDNAPSVTVTTARRSSSYVPAATSCMLLHIGLQTWRQLTRTVVASQGSLTRRDLVRSCSWS